MRSTHRRRLSAFAPALLPLLLAACGEGGGGKSSDVDATLAPVRDMLPNVDPDGAANVTPDAADAPPDAALPEPDLAVSADVSVAPDLDASVAPTPDAHMGPDPLPDASHEPPPPAADCAAFAGLHDAALVDALHHFTHDAYRAVEAMPDQGGTPNRYTTARHYMFTEIERLPLANDVGVDGAQGVECIYTGAFFPLGPDEEPDHAVLNTEHVRARSTLNQDRDSLLYSHEQSDLHHLYPEQAGANSTRGSLPFGDPVDITDATWAPALIGTDAAGQRVFQPRAERRGDIARAMFYMTVRWGLDLPDDEEAILRAWEAVDPVDARDQARNDRVEAIQGNRNPFVDCPGLADQITDFAGFDSLDTNDNLAAP